MDKCLILLILGLLYLGKKLCVKLLKVLFSCLFVFCVIVLKIIEDLLDFDMLVKMVILFFGICKLMFFKLFFCV